VSDPTALSRLVEAVTETIQWHITNGYECPTIKSLRTALHALPRREQREAKQTTGPCEICKQTMFIGKCPHRWDPPKMKAFSPEEIAGLRARMAKHKNPSHAEPVRHCDPRRRKP